MPTAHANDAWESRDVIGGRGQARASRSAARPMAAGSRELRLAYIMVGRRRIGVRWLVEV